MDGHWFWVYVGRDGNNVCILLLCNYSLEWLSLCCTILVVSATGLVCLGFLCRYASLCEDKKNLFEVLWVCGLKSVYMGVT